MEHFSNDQEDHPNQCQNSHKQCDEMGHLVKNMTESQWKLRQQHDQKQVQNDNAYFMIGHKTLSFIKFQKQLFTDVFQSRCS